MKRLPDLDRLLTDSEFSTKVSLYMSTKTAGDDYDPREKNYTYTNLNPVTIKVYAREITPESAFYRQYGTAKAGAMELICKDTYRTWFENAKRIVINSTEYETYKDATGARVSIVGRPYKMIRVILSRKE